VLLRLTLRGQRSHQKQSHVLLPPVLLQIARRLLQQPRHIRRENRHYSRLELRGQGLNQVGGSPAPRVRVTSLNVLADVLLRVVLEDLDVHVAQEQIRYDYLLADALQRLFVLEELLVLRPLDHGGDELDRVADEEVVLGLEARRDQQVPHGRDELGKVVGEVLAVVLREQGDVVADLGLDLFEEAGLVAGGVQEWVVVGEEGEEVGHPDVHCVLELLGKVLGVERAEDLAGEG